MMKQLQSELSKAFGTVDSNLAVQFLKWKQLEFPDDFTLTLTDGINITGKSIKDNGPLLKIILTILQKH